MSDGARQAPGRRASDNKQFVDELSRTLSDVEKANNLLRCQVQDLRVEIREAKAQLLASKTRELSLLEEITQLQYQVMHEQALRRKAEVTAHGRAPTKLAAEAA